MAAPPTKEQIGAALERAGQYAGSPTAWTLENAQDVGLDPARGYVAKGTPRDVPPPQTLTPEEPRPQSMAPGLGTTGGAPTDAGRTAQALAPAPPAPSWNPLPILKQILETPVPGIPSFLPSQNTDNSKILPWNTLPILKQILETPIIPKIGKESEEIKIPGATEVKEGASGGPASEEIKIPGATEVKESQPAAASAPVPPQKEQIQIPGASEVPEEKPPSVPPKAAQTAPNISPPIPLSQQPVAQPQLQPTGQVSGAPTGTADQPWGPLDPHAQQQALIAQGKTPGEAQAIVAGQQPKTLAGKTPESKAPAQTPSEQQPQQAIAEANKQLTPQELQDADAWVSWDWKNGSPPARMEQAYNKRAEIARGLLGPPQTAPEPTQEPTKPEQPPSTSPKIQLPAPSSGDETPTTINKNRLYGTSTGFGLNDDGSWDRQDNGIGFFGGINTRNPHLRAVAVPVDVLQGIFGTFTKKNAKGGYDALDTPEARAIIAKIRSAHVELPDPNGKIHKFPIVDIQGSLAGHPGKVLDMTLGARKEMGFKDNHAVSYQIIGGDGKPYPIPEIELAGGGGKRSATAPSQGPSQGPEAPSPQISLPFAGGSSKPLGGPSGGGYSGGGGGGGGGQRGGEGSSDAGGISFYPGGFGDGGGGRQAQPQPQQKPAQPPPQEEAEHPMVTALMDRGFTRQEALNFAQSSQAVVPGKGVGPLQGVPPPAPSAAAQLVTPKLLAPSGATQLVTPKLLSAKELMPRKPLQLGPPPPAPSAPAKGATPPKQAPPAPTPQAAVKAPAPRPATAPLPYTGAPAGSTHGIPNPPGSEAITKWPRLTQQAQQHAAILSPDDPRVKKQADGKIKGEHFVPGDPLHDQLLNGLPNGHGGRQRQILGQAEQAIADKQPMHISYISAPKEAALHPTRESRMVQYEEHSPEARLMGTTEGQLVGHSMIPVSVGITPSRKTTEPHQGVIHGISTNVLANNFHHINAKLVEMGRSTPYSELGPKFTNDLEGYLSNLNAGHTGTGRGHAVGTAEYPNAPDENHVPYHLTRREADFLNTTINNTAAFAKHADAQALRRLAEANGTLITPEGETNRLRHEMEQHEPGWRQRVLEPSIRTFKTGLIHEVHPSEEHMPATIRPGKEYQNLTKAIQRTSERGRPDVPISVSPRSQPPASMRRDLAHNQLINRIEREFSEERINEAEARAHLHAIGENPDEYRFVGGSGGLITPYEDNPEAITHEEHAQMKDNLRKQWVGGKLGVEDYRRKVAEVPLPEKPSQPAQPKPLPEAETPETPKITAQPAPKPVISTEPATPSPAPSLERVKSAAVKADSGKIYEAPFHTTAQQRAQHAGETFTIDKERKFSSPNIGYTTTHGRFVGIDEAKALNRAHKAAQQASKPPEEAEAPIAPQEPAEEPEEAKPTRPPAPDEPLPTKKPAKEAPAAPQEPSEMPPAKAKGPPAPDQPLPAAKPEESAPGDVLPPVKGKKEKVKTPEQIEDEKKEEDRHQAAIDRDDISDKERAEMVRLNKLGKAWVKQNPEVHDLSMHAHLTGKRQFPGKLKNEQIGEYYDANNPKLDYENEEHREHVSHAVVHDIMHSLAGTTTGGKPSEAYGWYDRTVRKSLKKTGEIAPKILTDPEHELAWKLALAITSQGQDVYPNAESTWHAYRHWIQTGKLPESREIFGGGLKAEQMEENFKKVNKLWKDRGTETFKKLLMKRMTVAQLKEKFPGLDVPGELANHEVNGAMFMGPKIGAFFSNLNGDYDPTTMDLWFSRNMNLMAGNMFKFSDETTRVDRIEKGKLVKSHLSQLKDALDSGMLTAVDQDRAKKMSAELSALMAHPEGQLDRPTARALAPEIYNWANEQHKTYQRSYGSKAEGEQEGSYHEDFKTPENLTAKKLDESTSKLSDAPRNGTERFWWRDIMARANQKLKAAKVRLTNGDKQALLWFNIKDLFRLAGSPQRDKADYLDAAYTLVRKVKEGSLPALPSEELEQLKKAA